MILHRTFFELPEKRAASLVEFARDVDVPDASRASTLTDITHRDKLPNASYYARDGEITLPRKESENACEDQRDGYSVSLCVS